jgi:ribokinase
MGSTSIFVLGSFVIACSAKVMNFPKPGESLAADAFAAEAGGKGFNFAVGARRLGAAVDGIFVVGDDLFGDLAEPCIVEAGLQANMLRRRSGPTGSGIGFTNAHGENCLAVHPGTNLLLSVSDVRTCSAGLSNAELVMAQFEIPNAPIAEAFRLARKFGTRTLLNPSPYREIEEGILENTSILVVNRVEAAALASSLGSNKLSPSKPDEFARVADRLFAMGTEILVITLGADGAIAYSREGSVIRQVSFNVSAVDTMGAGDAFAAGFAVALLEQRSLTECLAWAAACGALVVSKRGVLNALPTREAVEYFMAEKEATYVTLNTGCTSSPVPRNPPKINP